LHPSIDQLLNIIYITELYKAHSTQYLWIRCV